MAKSTKTITWTVKGRAFKTNEQSQQTIQPDQDLEIKEKASTLEISGSEGPYGEPISTGVAVHLIGNMLSILSTSKKKITDILEAYSPFIGEKESVVRFLLTDEDAAALNSLRKLITKSMAITFDKSQILRIISQPGCEGVRFYQAVRKDDKGNDIMTLVCVGLNKDAYDLNYAERDNNGTILQSSIPEARVAEGCESLVLDWAHPPGNTVSDSPDETTTQEKKQDPIHDMYVLLKMAEAAKYNNNKS